MQQKLAPTPLIIISRVVSHDDALFISLAKKIEAQTFPWFSWFVLLEDADHDLSVEYPSLGGRIRYFEDERLWASSLSTITCDILLLLTEYTDFVPLPQYLEYGFWGLHLNRHFSCLHYSASEKKIPAPPLFVRTSSILNLLQTGADLPELYQWATAQQILCLPDSDVCSETFDQSVSLPLSDKANLFTPLCPVNWPLKHNNRDSLRVLLVAPWLQMGGGDKFNLELLQGLADKGHQVGIITTLSDTNTWQNRFCRATADVFCLADFLNREHFPVFLQYYIQTREIDVLMVSNSEYGYYILPWLRIQFPRLAVVDYVHMPEPSWRSGGYARQSGFLSEFLDKTYTCNQYSCRQLVASYHHDADKTDTVYIGVDAAEFAPLERSAPLIRKQLGIEQHRPLVLFPCRMAAQKRPFLMLEIAKTMHDAGGAPAFVAAGDGPDLPEMRRYIQEHQLENTVYLAGAQDDLRPFYHEASLTLICSLYEGLSLTAYESMAMETPVITSDVGGQAELVNNKNGVVIPTQADEAQDLMIRGFDPGERDAYVCAIRELLANPEGLREKGRLARQRVLEGFTTQSMVDFFAKELPQLATKRKEVPFNVDKPPILLFEEMAILAGEYAKKESALQREHLHVLSLLDNSVPPTLLPTFSTRLWQIATPVTNAVSHIPVLRKLLTRNRKR